MFITLADFDIRWGVQARESKEKKKKKKKRGGVTIKTLWDTKLIRYHSNISSGVSSTNFGSILIF